MRRYWKARWTELMRQISRDVEGDEALSAGHHRVTSRPWRQRDLPGHTGRTGHTGRLARASPPFNYDGQQGCPWTGSTRSKAIYDSIARRVRRRQAMQSTSRSRSRVTPACNWPLTRRQSNVRIFSTLTETCSTSQSPSPSISFNSNSDNNKVTKEHDSKAYSKH